MSAVTSTANLSNFSNAKTNVGVSLSTFQPFNIQCNAITANMINSDTPDVVNLEGKVGINVEQVVSPAVAGITTIAGAPNTAQTVYIGGNDGSEYGGNTGIKTVYIASTEQKNVVSIANYQTDGSVDIGGAMLDGEINIGHYVGAAANTRMINIGATNSGTDGGTINIGCGNGYIGGNTTVNIGTGATSTVNIGTGSDCGPITIGTDTSLTSTVTIKGAAGITLANSTTFSLEAIFSNPDVQMTPTNVSSSSASQTNNARIGKCSYTGFTTAAGATQVLTVVNLLATPSKNVFVSVDNDGAADAQITLQRVSLQTSGSIIVTVKNNGAAALAGGVIHVNFWVMN